MPADEGTTTQIVTIGKDARGILQQAGHHNVGVVIDQATFQVTLVSGGSAAPPPVAEPELAWLTLADAFQVDGIDLLGALRWDYRLVEGLYGREADLAKIMAWAEAPSLIPTARLVAGEGGAGKTRLAATTAARLRESGWTAGFLKPDNPVTFAVAEGKGLFLILDHPEETLDLTRALIEKLADTKTAPYPVRLLLLSRRDFAQWEREALILGGRFGKEAIAAPKALFLDEGMALIAEAATNFSTCAKRSPPPLTAATAWLNEAELHRLPLYAAAAAIHAVLEPEAAFGIDGTEIVRNLANRERRRVRNLSRKIGLGDATLGRFLALGILADGLRQSAIKRLIEAGIGDECPKDIILGRLQHTPWWKAGRLVRLQPDQVAAAFLQLELFSDFPEGDDRLAGWLAVALVESASNLGSRLGRVLFDLDTIDRSREGAHPLERQLHAMLAADRKRALAFAPIASAEVPYPVASFAGRIAIDLANAAYAADDKERAARFFNNAANFLQQAGQREAALAAAQEAAGLHRDLARARPEAFSPYLAGSLNNLANMLSALGQREAALAGAQEAARLYRDLARARPEAFMPDLPLSLNTLANRLSDLGQREAALAAAQEAAALNDPVLKRFRAAVTEIYGDRVDRIVLFGSRARGDADEESDYDIAVFLRDMSDQPTEMNRLADLATDILYTGGPFIHAMPYPASFYNDQRVPLMHAIRAEGIDL